MARGDEGMGKRGESPGRSGEVAAGVLDNTGYRQTVLLGRSWYAGQPAVMLGPAGMLLGIT